MNKSLLSSKEIKYLIDIYNSAKERFNLHKQVKVQKGSYWKKYDDLNFNHKKLYNFREINGLSKGLDDNHIMNFNFSHYKIYEKILTDEFILKNMSNRNIGNSPYNILYKDHFIDPNKLAQLIWYKLFNESVSTKPNEINICEIGGGFGSFSELFIRNINSKIISIDLPEANLMTSYYLKELFPNKSYYLFDNYIEKELLTFEDFNSHDIFILPPNCNIDERIKIDLFINARSMMEMEREVIESYFNFIQKHIAGKGYFLNINRYFKGNRSGNHPTRLDNYPYDEDWKIIRSQPLPGQDWIHFLLTKRTQDSNKKNIKSHLQEIAKYLEDNPEKAFPPKIRKKLNFN